VITPVNIDRLAAALRVLEWKLIYELNLARGSPAEAADEAAYVANAVGANLLAFQIGNEPDEFGRWTGVQPASYDVSAYLAEWRAFHAAIRARVPGALFGGPDVAGATEWVVAFAQAMPEGLLLLTHHYYAEAPAGAPHVSLPKLLQSNRQLRPLLERLAQYSRAYRLPYWLTETNSVYNEGQPGVSDTLGAALWGLELMFQATAGAAGINFHGGVSNRRASDDKAYTPIARSGDRYRAMPLYYSMLMFAQASRGALVPVHLAPDTSGVKAFAVRPPEGTLRVCLINQGITSDERVAITPRRKFTVASMLRLARPTIEATAGVTLGGASVDDFGGWAPSMSEEVRLPDHEIIVDVPRGQCRTGILARVVSFSPQRGARSVKSGGVTVKSVRRRRLTVFKIMRAYPDRKAECNTLRVHCRGAITLPVVFCSALLCFSLNAATEQQATQRPTHAASPNFSNALRAHQNLR
jgi:hypothetical protein